MRIRCHMLLALTLLLLGMLVCGTAVAELDCELTFTSGTAEEGAEVERLIPFARGSFYYLALPAGWDSSALRLSFTKHDTLYADVGEDERIPVANGAVTDAFSRARDVALYNERGRAVCSIRVLQGSLPAVFINTASGSVKTLHTSKSVRESGEIRYIDRQGGVIHADTLREIRIRGNSTQAYSKKPYQIKLENKKELIPGAGKARTWVLLADHLDLALLRNRISLDMAQYIGMRFALSCQSVDLYVNGYYSGVYLLTEKAQVNASRVVITEQDDEMAEINDYQALDSFPRLEEKTGVHAYVAGFDIPNTPEDLTGGYLLQLDKYSRVRQEQDHGYVITEQKQSFVIESPENASWAQAEYVADFLGAIERAINAKDGIDPQTGSHYTELIDIDSFALKYLMEDFCINFDAMAGSQFFYKDTDAVDGKLYAGPLWDYDLTFSAGTPLKPSKQYLATESTKDCWWSMLYSHQPLFRQRVYELYQERIVPAVEVLMGTREPTPGMSLRSVDDYAAEIEASAAMNFRRNLISNIKGYNANSGTSHDASVDYIKYFLRMRSGALDELYAKQAE